MANTLNFGAAAKAGTFETPLQSVSDKLMQYGKVLNEREDIAAREKLAADRDAYQKSRDTLQDTRYEADKKQKADENDALANYVNQTNMFQSGNALTTAQGQEISDMANNLTASGVTGVDFDKQLNDRVSRMQSENTARLKDNPMAVLQNVKENVVIPQGVDPSKIIQINQNLEDKFMRMQEKKDDLAYRTLRDKQDDEFKRKQLNMQQQQLNESRQEKIDQKNAIINSRNAKNETITDPNLSGLNETVINKETGKMVIPEQNKGTYQSEINKTIESDKTTGNLKRIEEIANSGLYTDRELNDPVKLQQILKEKYPEEYKAMPITSDIKNLKQDIKDTREKEKEINKIKLEYPFERIIPGFTSQEKIDEINKAKNQRDIKIREVEQKYAPIEKKDNSSDLVQRLKTENTSKLNEIDKLVNENTKSVEEKDKELRKTLGVKETVSKKIPKGTEEYGADLYDSMIKKIKNPTVYDVEKVGKIVDDMAAKYDVEKKDKETAELKLQLKNREKADDKTKNLVDIAKQDRAGKVAELNQIKSGAAIKEDLLDDEGNDISKENYVKLLNEKIYDYDKKINSLLKITDEDIQSELKR